MQPSVDELFDELRALIAALGDGGGLISPSVYDTAQLLRHAPPAAGVAPGLAWLLAQQHADGGWGEPTSPPARDVSTLAAVVALATYRHDDVATQAIRRGLDYLRGGAAHWGSIHMDAIPIAAEMILPMLLQDAARLNLGIDPTPYARLFALREKKLAVLTRVPIKRNSAPTYSWEALGLPYSPDVLDERSGVGHSPAATAAWLAAARAAGESPDRIAQAEDYLARAETATQTGIPGVVPVFFPVTGFEYSYGLYALLLTGLLDHPQLQQTVAVKVTEMETAAQSERGLSSGDGFVLDVDVVAVATAVLAVMSREVSDSALRRFWNTDHFYTFANELNPSVYSNAHALHALTLCGTRCGATERFLISRQTETGAWIADKWHTSWRSTLLEVVLALHTLGYPAQLRRAGQALVADQRDDGSWGTPAGTSYLETTYAVMALRLIQSSVGLTPSGVATLERANSWLAQHASLRHGLEARWLGKEVYSPLRVDRMYRIATLCRLRLDAVPTKRFVLPDRHAAKAVLGWRRALEGSAAPESSRSTLPHIS